VELGDSGRAGSDRGFKLIFGAGEGGAAGAVGASLRCGAPGVSAAAGAGNGAAVCSNRGFSRRAEGGGVCSSLISGDKSNFHLQRETKKFPSRSAGAEATFRPVFNMTKALLLLLTLATLAASSGCAFSRKARRAKESSSISADVEESFRKRWVEKRAGELATQGTTADAARTQAEAEFRERFGFTRAAAQK
jgi:hypothetical protein